MKSIRRECSANFFCDFDRFQVILKVFAMFLSDIKKIEPLAEKSKNIKNQEGNRTSVQWAPRIRYLSHSRREGLHSIDTQQKSMRGEDLYKKITTICSFLSNFLR